VKLPAALKDLPRGPTTTVATLTFSRYGASVHVAAPPKSALLPQAGISTSFGIAVSNTCGRRS
jgi:hypothetical protein